MKCCFGLWTPGIAASAAMVTAATLFGAILRAADGTVPGGPRLVAPERLADMGTVPEPRAVEHTFVVTNEGTAPLIVSRILRSCGCVSAQMTHRTIPPGGQSSLIMRVTLKSRVGPQTQTTYLETNDPAERLATFRLLATLRSAGTGGQGRTATLTAPAAGPAAGARRPSFSSRPGKASRSHTSTLKEFMASDVLKPDIIERVAYRPKTIVLVAESQGSPVRRDRWVVIEAPVPFEVTEVELPDARMETHTSTEADGGWRVTVRISDIVPRQRLDGTSIRLTTNLPELPRVEVPIEIIVLPDAP